MKVKSKLLFISVIAFVGFLVAYGKAFYEWGFNNSLTGLTLIFLFPMFYFLLTVVALVLRHKNSFEKLPYIVMSVLSSAFMAIMWFVYFFVRSTEDAERVFMFHQELWFPILLSILSVVISISYISILVEIVKDKCVSRGENEINRPFYG